MGYFENLDGTLKNTFTLGDGTTADRYIQEDIGTANYPGFRRLNSNGYWEYSDDGIVWQRFGSGTGGDAWKPQINVGSLLVRIDQGARILEANELPALEIDRSKTRFGIWSGTWQVAPTSDVKLQIKFILSENATQGTYVRVAAKVKAIAAGEDSAKAFDSSQFVAVPVTYSNHGPIYYGEITFSSSIFAAHDTVLFHIGRDGNNEMGSGDNDNFNKPIDIIGIEVL